MSDRSRARANCKQYRQTTSWRRWAGPIVVAVGFAVAVVAAVAVCTARLQSLAMAMERCIACCGH